MERRAAHMPPFIGMVGGADYDVCYHPSARFWWGICHHGWAEGKSDEASVALQTLSCLRGIGGGAHASCFVAGKISPSSSRWSLPDLLVPVSWCARAVTLEGKGCFILRTPKLFLDRSPVWVSSLAFRLDSGSLKCPITAGLSPVLQDPGR